MKRFFIPLVAICISLSGFAQETAESQEFQFTTLKEIPISSIQNQSSTSTCWSFSGLSLIEAELLRQGRGEHDLSKMFVAHKNFGEKAVKYVRMHGATNFHPGGSFEDVLCCIRDHGIVPSAIQPGLNYGETLHQHDELDKLLRAYVDVVITNPNKKLSTAWRKGFTGILDAYLGECPQTFTYNGKQYTPQSYAQSLGIRTEDYISLTSFTHHPFYTSFPIEIPDNWRWAYSYNLPLNEFMQVIDNAIDKGYTVAWGTDVSEKGYTRNGIAVISGIDGVEKKITQEMRQEAFDNYETQDDHGMLIFGTAQDQNGYKYYMVKNSYGTERGRKGVWYASVPYVQYKTINIMVHKDAIPKEIRNKLGLK